jgi:hypothetical protein
MAVLQSVRAQQWTVNSALTTSENPGPSGAAFGAGFYDADISTIVAGQGVLGSSIDRPTSTSGQFITPSAGVGYHCDPDGACHISPIGSPSWYRPDASAADAPRIPTSAAIGNLSVINWLVGLTSGATAIVPQGATLQNGQLPAGAVLLATTGAVRPNDANQVTPAVPVHISIYNSVSYYWAGAWRNSAGIPD